MSVDAFEQLRESGDVGLSRATMLKSNSIIEVTFFNDVMCKNMKLKVARGKWLNTVNDDGVMQAVVSQNLKSNYKIGKTYGLNLGAGFESSAGAGKDTVQVKIIGYLKNTEKVFTTSYGGENIEYLQLFGSGNNNDIVVLSNNRAFNVYVDSNGGATYVKSSGMIFKSTLNLAKFQEDTKLTNKANNEQYTSIKYTSMLNLTKFNFDEAINFNIKVLFCLITFAVAIINIMGTTLGNFQVNIKRNSIKYMYGQTQTQIVLVELIRLVTSFLLPVIVNVVCFWLFNVELKNPESEIGDSYFAIFPNPISAGQVALAALIMLATYVLASLVSLIKLFKTNLVRIVQKGVD